MIVIEQAIASPQVVTLKVLLNLQSQYPRVIEGHQIMIFFP